MSKSDANGWVIDNPEILVDLLLEDGWRVIGPRVQDSAIVYEPLRSGSDLPKGFVDRQAPGEYRIDAGDPERWFDYTVSPQNWKRWLFPPRHKLWEAEKSDDGFAITAATDDWQKTVFFGIRPCDLAALEILGTVFSSGGAEDGGFRRRRAETLTVVVQCARSADTCFCASMETGPHARAGFDIGLTELAGTNGRLLVTSGSDAGGALAAKLGADNAAPEDFEHAEETRQVAAGQQSRSMPKGISDSLKASLESTHWDDVASRCLACANCTLACPTCFCTDVEDINDLSGDKTERWRVWDSCFNLDFSYIHGGLIRTSVKSRYRQWMTHKLSSWHDQFGSSGCVGCGRCIAWCPVGIDITKEAGAITREIEVAEVPS